MTDLTGKVAVVTGSARGIGRAIALRYASMGASVVINYSTDEDNARRTLGEVEDAGGRGIVVQADASSLTDLDRLFAAAINTFGSLDIVVANAGREVIGQPAIEVTEEEFDRVFAVNSKGAVFTLIKAAKLISDGGRLIYVGSSTTLSPYPGMGLYSSSKTAAANLVRILALELGPRDITVNTILPTATAGAGVFTDVVEGDEFHQMNAQLRPIGGRGGTPEDTADAAEYLAGNLAGWVSGQALVVTGGAVQ
ncbi:SDR family oxidoreductase [Promicromonospora kroppenstedtii]|uniref:SDR family oxidoreductase n=1 Tax=Promicromonospora kroppenstedtii TaxID=440482 RepID=UPI0004B25187|nr:SDR family oxidoreductase [Promicromonospora kroppenstedtii]